MTRRIDPASATIWLTLATGFITFWGFAGRIAAQLAVGGW